MPGPFIRIHGARCNSWRTLQHQAVGGSVHLRLTTKRYRLDRSLDPVHAYHSTALV